MATAKDEATTHFLNVDLQICSKWNLQPLVSALGNKVIVLYCERWKRTYVAGVEIAGMTKDADATIRAFCPLIRALPGAARQVWNSAKTRDFNIGIQCRDEPSSRVFVLAAETVKEVSKLGARIVFTVYSPKILTIVVPSPLKDNRA